ncbi:MAG: immunity 53 family protein [Kouleothrix sp.]|jgi:hypothetical protein|nr:immunity 53 family protein [Kouleothrix sp.]
MHTLTRLQKWYESYCDGDWEHGFGIRITTLDNPGWSMTINLEGTDLENQPFSPIEDIEPERDWIRCWVTENTFHGVGGPQKLEAMIELFLDWADTHKNGE